MKLFWLSTILVVLSNIGYHVCQKSIPSAANPLVSVIVTFTIAIVVSFALLPLFPSEGSFVSGLKSLN